MPKKTTLELVQLNNKDLVEYIVNYFHTQTRDRVHEIQGLITNYLEKNDKHKEALNSLSAAVHNFAIEMFDHLDKEEELIFPMILEYYDNVNNAYFKTTFGSSLEQMELDHEEQSFGLDALKDLTREFRAPDREDNELVHIYYKVEELYYLTRDHIDMEAAVLYSRF